MSLQTAQSKLLLAVKTKRTAAPVPAYEGEHPSRISIQGKLHPRQNYKVMPLTVLVRDLPQRPKQIQQTDCMDGNYVSLNTARAIFSRESFSFPRGVSAALHRVIFLN